MPCKDYREALIEAAALGAASSRELRSHLDACASCRAIFNEELQLFAAMDSGLRATANAEVPASLLPRVRIQLNERPAPPLSWVPAGAAIAAAAAIILAVAYFGGGGRGGVEPNPRTISVAGNDLPAVIQPSPRAVAPNRKVTPPVKRKLLRPFKNPGAAEAAEVEAARVIVPAGEKRGMQALLTNLQQGKVSGEVLLAEKAEKTLQELQFPPLDIAPIEVKPLSDVSTGPASENIETKR